MGKSIYLRYQSFLSAEEARPEIEKGGLVLRNFMMIPFSLERAPSSSTGWARIGQVRQRHAAGNAPNKLCAVCTPSELGAGRSRGGKPDNARTINCA